MVHQVATQIIRLVCGAQMGEGRMQRKSGLHPFADRAAVDEGYGAARVVEDRPDRPQAVFGHDLMAGPQAKHGAALQGVEPGKKLIRRHQSMSGATDIPQPRSSSARCWLNASRGAPWRRYT